MERLEKWTVNFSTKFGFAVNERKANTVVDLVLNRMNKTEKNSWSSVENQETGEFWTNEDWNEGLMFVR